MPQDIVDSEIEQLRTDLALLYADLSRSEYAADAEAEYADRLNVENAALRENNERLRGVLRELVALVCNECPSLLDGADSDERARLAMEIEAAMENAP